MISKRVRAACALFFLFGLAACSSPRQGIPFSSPTPSPAPSKTEAEMIQGSTISDKAYSIAEIVSQKHKNLLVLMDGRMVQNDMIVMDSDGKGSVKFIPLWLKNKEEPEAKRGRVYGLAYTFAVIKQGKLISQEDLAELTRAAADIMSLSAQYLLPNPPEKRGEPDTAQADSTEFSFVDIYFFLSSVLAQGSPVAVRAVDIVGIHASVADLAAEKAKGDGASWIGFVLSPSHEDPQFPFGVPGG